MQWVTRRGGSGGSVMVWAALSWNHLSSIEMVDGTMTGAKYATILRDVAIPFGLASVGPGFLLQDDNATPHRCVIVQQIHNAQLQYVHMDWPANSPDLNPIEHLWDELGRRLAKRNIQNLAALAPAIAEEWAAIPQQPGAPCHSLDAQSL